MWILGCALAIHFVIRSGFLLWYVAPGVGPDEMFHLQSIASAQAAPYRMAFHVEQDGVLQPDPAAGRFGAMVAAPPLNAMVFGSLASLFRLDVFEMKTIRLFRFLNFLLAVGALWLGGLLITEAFAPGLPVLLAGAITTNLLMFVDLSVTVTYDNLLFFFSNLGLLFLTRLTRRFTLRSLLWCVIGVTGACLSKLSAIPMFGFAAMLFAIPLWRRFRRDRSELTDAADRVPSLAILAISAAVLSLGCVTFYGWNISRYGSWHPSCESLFSEATCRANYYSQYDDECINLPDAERATFPRFLANWSYKMIESALGVKSFVCILFPAPYVILTGAVLAIGLLGYGRLFRRSSVAAQCSTLLILPYVALLSYYWNYLSCPRLESPGINGRYLFPMFAPLMGATCTGLVSLFPLKFQRSGTALTSLLFVMLTCPLFQFDWFFGSRDQAFYRNLPYYPNPVYDLTFHQVP